MFTLTPAHWGPRLLFVQQHELCVWRQTQKVGVVGHYRPIVLEDHCYWIRGAEAEKLWSCGKKRQTQFSDTDIWRTAVGCQTKRVLNTRLVIWPRIIRFMPQQWTNLLIFALTLARLLWLMLFLPHSSVWVVSRLLWQSIIGSIVEHFNDSSQIIQK